MIAPRLLWIALLAAMIPARVLSSDADDDAVKRKGWFKPTLVENHSKFCTAFFDRTRDLFYSANDLDQLPREFALPQLENESFSGRSLEIFTHGQRAYLVNRTLGGCGGACERREVHATAQVPIDDGDWGKFMWSLHNAPPPAVDDVVLRSSDNEYFVAQIAEGKAQLHQLTANLHWALACEVEITPADLSALPDPRVRRALNAITDLERATEGVRGGSGSCGTLNPQGLHGYYMSNALRLAIYRPWVMHGPLSALPVAPPGYDGLLKEWSLQGISEFRAYETFRAQRAQSVRDIATFYREEFGWSIEQATAAAAHALDDALESGFAYPETVSFFAAAEAPLRRALLEHRPMAEIRQLGIATEDEPADSFDAHFHDSILAVAVEYPQALEWLLEHGIEVDRANAFGKTPLMHAAQRNSVESARLLLDHGADPNATTVLPDDNCFYTLSQSNVTPLHYAVRNGSRELIELLVARGARPFIGVNMNELPPRWHMPLEWLETYTARDAVERNPHLSEDDVVALRELLRLPDSEARRKIAADLTTAAEGRYTAGDIEAGYRLLKQALAADPANERALTDMSLVGLRAHRQGEALVAATALIAQTTSNRTLAQAWFNLGLACESGVFRSLYYDGSYYCTSSPIHPFLRAWVAAPSAARASKLESVLTASARVCDARSTGANYVYMLTTGDDLAKSRNGQDALIYVRHPLDTPAAGIDISWQVPSQSGLIRPQLVETHTIDGFQLSLLRSEIWPPATLHMHGQECVCDNKGCAVWNSMGLLMQHVEQAIAPR